MIAKIAVLACLLGIAVASVPALYNSGYGYGAYGNGYGAYGAGYGGYGAGYGGYGGYGYPGAQATSYVNVVKHVSPKAYSGAYSGYGGAYGGYGGAYSGYSGLAYGSRWPSSAVSAWPNAGHGYAGYGNYGGYGYGAYGNGW